MLPRLPNNKTPSRTASYLRQQPLARSTQPLRGKLLGASFGARSTPQPTSEGSRCPRAPIRSAGPPLLGVTQGWSTLVAFFPARSAAACQGNVREGQREGWARKAPGQTQGPWHHEGKLGVGKLLGAWRCFGCYAKLAVSIGGFSRLKVASQLWFIPRLSMMWEHSLPCYGCETTSGGPVPNSRLKLGFDKQLFPIAFSLV